MIAESTWHTVDGLKIEVRKEETGFFAFTLHEGKSRCLSINFEGEMLGPNAGAAPEGEEGHRIDFGPPEMVAAMATAIRKHQTANPCP